MNEAMTALDVVLALGIVTTAALATTSRDRVVSVMMFLSLGVLLAITWARLAAPDIAMAEAAIAAGVTGALLISAIGALRQPARTERASWISIAGQVAVIAVATTMLAVGLVSANDQHTGPAPAGAGALDALDEAAVDHPITVVLLQFRSYDTLLEIVVLGAVALVAFALPTDDAVTTLGLRSDRGELFGGLVRVLLPVLVLLAGWLLVAGSTRPGGAFQAGALVAGVVLLLYLDGRIDPARSPRISNRWLIWGVLIGPGAFIALAGITATLGDGWLHIAPAWGGWVIIGLEALLALSIGVSLAAAFLAGRAQLPLLDPSPSFGDAEPSGRRRATGAER